MTLMIMKIVIMLCYYLCAHAFNPVRVGILVSMMTLFVYLWLICQDNFQKQAVKVIHTIQADKHIDFIGLLFLS